MVAKCKQLCVVRIGIDDYLLPMAEGLKLVSIMTNAVGVCRTYDSGNRWQIERKGGIEIGLTLAHPKDIIDPAIKSTLAIAFQGGGQ